MTIIRNSFHNTEYHSKKSAEDIRVLLNTSPGNLTAAQKAFGRKVWRNLCGIEGCLCGGEIGQRGKQDFDEPDRDYPPNV